MHNNSFAIDAKQSTVNRAGLGTQKQTRKNKLHVVTDHILR